MNEIPTCPRRLRHIVGTVVFIILAACVSALILTAPVWSADDLALPASGRPAVAAAGASANVAAPTLVAEESGTD